MPVQLLATARQEIVYFYEYLFGSRCFGSTPWIRTFRAACCHHQLQLITHEIVCEKHLYAASLKLVTLLCQYLCVLCSSHFLFLHPKKIWKFKSKPEFVLALSGWDILWKMNPSCDYGILFSQCLCFYDLTNHILTAPWLSLSFCPGGAPCSFPACTACN